MATKQSWFIAKDKIFSSLEELKSELQIEVINGLLENGQLQIALRQYNPKLNANCLIARIDL